jgi:hypothetical protein
MHPDYYGPGGWYKQNSVKTAVLGRAAGLASRAGAGGARIMKRIPKVPARAPGLPMRRMPGKLPTPPAQKATMQLLNQHVLARQAAKARTPQPSALKRMMPWAAGTAGAGTLAYLTWLLNQGRQQPTPDPTPVARQPQKPAPTVNNLRRAVK